MLQTLCIGAPPLAEVSNQANLYAKYASGEEADRENSYRQRIVLAWQKQCYCGYKRIELTSRRRHQHPTSGHSQRKRNIVAEAGRRLGW